MQGTSERSEETIKSLSERFGIKTQACAEWVEANLTLAEMRALLGPTDALEMAWPGGVPGRGGNMNQLPKAVAVAVRKYTERKMSGAARKNARMWA